MAVHQRSAGVTRTRIDAVARELSTGGADVRAVRADLRTSDGVERLYAAVSATGRPLDAALLNAGVGQGGPFVATDLADEFDIIDLNVRSTVHLAKLVLRDMAARHDGMLLITSSVASTMPGTFQAIYNASKSFLQSFAEALQNELKDTGVSVTSLMQRSRRGSGTTQLIDPRSDLPRVLNYPRPE